METVNNNVNPNQQPQPQKENENKKKNKIVAWWLGLSKWAKVGVCVGTAAVLATAITLPIVLTRDKTQEITLIQGGGGYVTENYITVKKDTRYVFKINEPYPGINDVYKFYGSKEGDQKTSLKSANLNTVQNDWAIKDNELTGTRINKDMVKGKIITITVVFGKDGDTIPTLDCNGGQ